MPAKRKSARLVWRAVSGRQPYWQIRDGTTRVSTGTHIREDAEEALARYLDLKYQPNTPVGPQELTISRALDIYAKEHAVHVADPARIGYAIDALDSFWGDQPVSIITGATCRKYSSSRKTRFGVVASPGTTRRELNVLQAALNYCHAEGYLVTPPKVTLPASPSPKERWLTRQEAAWLLKGARNLRADGRHLAQFILHGLYTGSRKQTILSMRIDTPSKSGGHVDTKTGVLYRKPQGKLETAKRQRPARLPPRYLSYLRIQSKNNRRMIVQDHKGHQIGDIRKGWANATQIAIELAAAKGIKINFDGVTPHTLKHTAITWALQNGATTWDTAGYFSTSIETIQKVYGHHSPDHQKTAVAALNRRK